jgi:protein-L-isoaspartate(D-aspartate) O-methyltransferase
MIPCCKEAHPDAPFSYLRSKGPDMKDDYRHKGLRKRLVEELREKGIRDEKVLAAIGEVPRHVFLDDAFLEYAYQDRAFPIDAGQTISQPYTVARQTALLEVSKGHHVLEIGTGSGYQAAVLSRMRARTVSVERQKKLYEKARYILETYGFKVRCFFGDGYEGAPSFAPFDRILVTCGAPEVPKGLLEQLKPGGIMVVPVGNEEQRMIRVDKREDGTLLESDHGPFHFVPMLDRKTRRE